MQMSIETHRAVKRDVLVEANSIYSVNLGAQRRERIRVVRLRDDGFIPGKLSLQTGYGAKLTSCSMVTGGWICRRVVTSVPSCAVVKNVRGCTFTPASVLVAYTEITTLHMLSTYFICYILRVLHRRHFCNFLLTWFLISVFGKRLWMWKKQK